MSGGARVDPAAIQEVAQALVRYGVAEEGVLKDVEGALRVARDKATSEQRRRRGELDQAEAALRACQRTEKADCSAPEAVARRARTRLEAAQQAMRQIEAAATRYQAVRSTHTALVQNLVQNGRSHLDRKARELAAYSAGGGGGSGGSGGGGGKVQRQVVGQIAIAAGKQAAKSLALPLLMQGVGQINENLDAPGVDDLIGDAITAVRTPGFGQVMAGQASQALHLKEIGAAVAHARARLRG